MDVTDDASKASLMASHRHSSDDDLAFHEIIIDAERGGQLSSKRRRDRLPGPANPVCWLLAALTVVAIFGWLGLFICLDGGCSRASTARKDLPGWSALPDFELSQKVRFKYNSSFTSGDEVAVQRVWDDLLAPAHGFISIVGAQKLGLRPGVRIDGYPGEGFALSVFHQLHCLSAMRKMLAQPPPSDQDSTLMQNAHLGHCVDYLRQQIMCSADTSLEHARVDGQQTEVSGWGVVHQCRDWNEVWKFARDNRLGRQPGTT